MTLGVGFVIYVTVPVQLYWLFLTSLFEIAVKTVRKMVRVWIVAEASYYLGR
jgi:hypothetical protein